MIKEEGNAEFKECANDYLPKSTYTLHKPIINKYIHKNMYIYINNIYIYIYTLILRSIETVALLIRK